MDFRDVILKTDWNTEKKKNARRVLVDVSPVTNATDFIQMMLLPFQ